MNKVYRIYVKRLLDMVFAVFLMPFLLFIIVVVGPVIYFQDKGPVFYNAPRLGKNGRVFRMYKFRSMKVNAPDIRNDDGSTFNSEDDPRLTKIGRFIRKTSIDETPQIMNVLKGDMSFVGPRPDLPEHREMYTEAEAQKLKVKPGITGYSQAYFRNSLPWKARIGKDIVYVNELSFSMDLKIFMKTVFSVLAGKAVYIHEASDTGNQGGLNG